MRASILSRSGVYQIVNRETGHCYIGSATNMQKRCAAHKLALGRGKHKNPYLQNAWNRYGQGDFDFRVLLVCAREDLVRYEQLCIDGFGSHHSVSGYNLCAVAYSTLGIPASLRQRSITRTRQLGVPNPRLVEVLNRPERKALSIATLMAIKADPAIEAKRKANAALGIRTPQAKANLSAARRGRKRTLAERAKQSARLKGILPKNFHRPEARDKWLAALQVSNRTRRGVRLVVVNGETLCVAQAAAVIGIKPRHVIDAVRRQGLTHQQVIDQWLSQRPKLRIDSDHP